MGQLVESIETLPVNVFLYSEDLGSDKIKRFPGALLGTKKRGRVDKCSGIPESGTQHWLCGLRILDQAFGLEVR